jgi:hypothetical protein
VTYISHIRPRFESFSLTTIALVFYSLPHVLGGEPMNVLFKGVGPGMTLAWPGWKQSVIAVVVDTGRLENIRFKKCCANCVLLFFPSTEIKSAFNVY